MYATTTVPHQELAADLNVRPAFNGTQVCAHLGDVYLSMAPEEAERLAEALTIAALRARAERIAAEAGEVLPEQEQDECEHKFRHSESLGWTCRDCGVEAPADVAAQLDAA